MINIDKSCTPILIGDMNATAYHHDRSSVNTYEADTMYRDFLDTNNLAPLLHAPDVQRPWTHCQAFGKDQFENTIYSFGRIDDILLPANLAAQCHPCQTCEQGLSDHLPLLAHIPTYILNASIPRIAQSQPTHNSNHQVNLVRPISITDQNAFLLALLDPSHGVYQQLEDTIQVLKPAHAEALAFLDGLQHTSAKQALRLKMICNRLAPEVIEEYAQVVSNLIQSTQELAFKTL